MKLYTEEQVRLMLFNLGDVLFNNCQNGINEGEPDSYVDNIIANQIPIELPSDEEEEVNAMSLTKNIQQHIGFNMGAKWMKEQLLNQNK